MTLIKMIQTSKYKWQLTTDNGIILLDGISLDNIYDANEYAENYVSSFIGWDFIVIPMEDIC